MAAGGNPTADQKIQHMCETVLDHRNPSGWDKAKTTHLVCKIDGDDTPLILTNDPRSGGDEHAESLLIKKLNENSTVQEINSPSDIADKLKKMSMDKVKTDSLEMLKIKIYINNSPCSDSVHNCSRKLIEFLNSNIRVRMILYVTNLYKIRRESCYRKGERHVNTISDGDHNDNRTGLRNLMLHSRCKIKAFTADVWEELFDAANVSQAVRYQLRADYSNRKGNNDRSRKEEDKRIKKDLTHIKDNP